MRFLHNDSLALNLLYVGVGSGKTDGLNSVRKGDRFIHSYQGDVVVL